MGRQPTSLLEDLPTRELRALDAGGAGQSDAVALLPGEAAVPRTDELAGRRLLGYRLMHRLGAGGMGVVYRAEHLWLERPVAIKLLPAEFMRDEDAVARFRREMRAVGRLDHPRIVRATDAGEVEGLHFLATELVDGIDLACLVRQSGPLLVADACEIVRQTAEALDYARRQGLVHRDIKPSNLMVTREGTVKVLDFGLARGEELFTTLTSSGMLMGTLDYMAPEQAGDLRHVDTRADLYSLGCTLYFLITGEPPFAGAAYSTPASKLKGHLEDRPRPVERLRRRVPLRVLSVLDRMLAKRPGDRFATPADVAASLAACCQGSNLARAVHLAGNGGRGANTSGRDCAIGRCGSLLGNLLTWLPRTAWRRVFRGTRAAPRREQPIVSLSGAFLLALLIGLFLFTGFSCERVDPRAVPWMDGPTGIPPNGVQILFDREPKH